MPQINGPIRQGPLIQGGAPSYGNSYGRPGIAAKRPVLRPKAQSGRALAYGRIQKQAYGEGPGYERNAFAASDFQTSVPFRSAPMKRPVAPKRGYVPQRPRNGLVNPKLSIKQNGLAR